MKVYTESELAEAARALSSLKSKCEKALPKLVPGSSQRTLTERRIEALRIALELIERELTYIVLTRGM